MIDHKIIDIEIKLLELLTVIHTVNNTNPSDYFII